MEDLNSILGSEQASAPATTAPAAPATSQATEPTTTGAAATATAVETGQAQATGENTAPPAEPRKDDPIEKHRKGLEAAALAERNRRQAVERERDEARAEIERMKQPAKPPVQQQQADAGKPVRAQFATEDEWLDARDAWRDQKAAAVTREQQETSQRQEREQQLQRVADDIVGKGKQQYPDFDDVINAGLGPVLDATRQGDALPLLQQALLQSERGHDVAYWLGKNPTEAWRVAVLGPWQMARELALIETRLETATAPVKEDKPAPQLPNTLTNERDSRGRFAPAYQGPTPLNAILST